MTGAPIVFYDGECALCDRFVRFLVRADKRGELRFAPLRGETARGLLPEPAGDPEQWTVVYLDEKGMHTRSEAALRILARAGGCWRWLAVLRVVPRCLRDPAYRFIARRRYRWFGKVDACPVPPPAMRGRWLP